MAMLLLALAASACDGSTAALLSARRYRAVLDRVRGMDARAYRQRGAAWLGLGKLRRAAQALRISRALDGDDPRTLSLVARVELRLGRGGAALAALQRAFFRTPRGLSRPSRVLLAGLLRLKAALRSDPKRRLGGAEQARAERAAAQAAGGGAQPGGRASVQPRLAALSLSACAGPPVVLPSAPPAAGPCRLRDPQHLRLELRARDLLVGCGGVALARMLEGRGCRRVALALWRDLRLEMPTDARWPLQVGRLELALGRLEAARVALDDHVFYAKPARSRACISAAKVLRLAGKRRLAARWLVRAIAFARDGAAALAALAALHRFGPPGSSVQAGRAVTARFPGVAVAVRRLLSLLSAAPRRPGR